MPIKIEGPRGRRGETVYYSFKCKTCLANSVPESHTPRIYCTDLISYRGIAEIFARNHEGSTSKDKPHEIIIQRHPESRIIFDELKEIDERIDEHELEPEADSTERLLLQLTLIHIIGGVAAQMTRQSHKREKDIIAYQKIINKITERSEGLAVSAADRLKRVEDRLANLKKSIPVTRTRRDRSN